MQSSCMAGQIYQDTQKITSVIKKAMLCVAPRGEFCGSQKNHWQLQDLNAELGTWLTNFCLQFHLIFSQGEFVNKSKELSWCCWERVALLVHAVLVHHHDVETVVGDPQQQPAKQGTGFVKGQHQPLESEQRKVGTVTGATQTAGLVSALTRSQIKSRCLHVSKWLHPALFSTSTHCYHWSETSLGKKKFMNTA